MQKINKFLRAASLAVLGLSSAQAAILSVSGSSAATVGQSFSLEVALLQPFDGERAGDELLAFGCSDRAQHGPGRARAGQPGSDAGRPGRRWPDGAAPAALSDSGHGLGALHGVLCNRATRMAVTAPVQGGVDVQGQARQAATIAQLQQQVS